MDIILPLITLVIGTFLGLLASIWMAYLQHKYDINVKIVEQYFEARGQLCDRLSTLASLQIVKDLDTATLLLCREEISKLFYKYYDFLPTEVLKEMLCLYACLADKENRMYKHQDNCLLFMDEQDIKELVEHISLVDNFKYYALIPLKSLDLNVRRIASVNYQARGVLNAINRHFTIQQLLSWNRYLQKSKKASVNLIIRDKFRETFVKVAHVDRKQAKQQLDPLGKQLPQATERTKDVDTIAQITIEKRLMATIATVLQIEESGVQLDTAINRMGIDSLMAVEIRHRINKDFGVSLSIAMLLSSATIRELTTEIEKGFTPSSFL